jgi:hypothetical protein
MNRKNFATLVAALFIGFILPLIIHAQNKKKNLFTKENLVAWCIVPFDNQNRAPAQRVEMLKRLGFTQYAYDWRHQHISSFAEDDGRVDMDR